MRLIGVLGTLALAWLTSGMVHSETVVDNRAIENEQQGANWLSYGRTYAEHHFSPLAAVNDQTISRLGLAWSLDLEGARTLEGTPLAIDGVLYFSGTYAMTYAVDAVTGKLLWRFDPEIGKHHPEKLRLLMGAHRGLAYWKGRVFVGTVDGRLVALDGKTGKVVWSVQTFDDPKSRKAISGAPRVFNDKVIIGHGGADFGTRGYVTAYDMATGKQLWRFHTVPGDPKKGFENEALAMAATTWSGEWWHWGGGGTVWDNMTYDPEFNRIYIGVGNGSPWNAEVRSPGGGDNLFLCSIVALDADTGKYVWHYQVNPRESWDYKATANMILADLKIDGVIRKVLMQAPTNGFFYVIDRVTGRVISAEKFAKVTWAERIDLKSGRPVEAANIRYTDGPVTFWPSAAGAHNWQPMAYSPVTGLVYIPTMKLAQTTAQAQNTDDLKNFEDDRRRYFPTTGNTTKRFVAEPGDGTSALLAWDPVEQRKRWEVTYSDVFWNGGALATKGNLVFQGTGRGNFIAYNATTGKQLWSFNAALGIVGSPMTYEVAGTQYISILVGYGGGAGSGTKLFDYGWRFNKQPRRLLTFALGKTAVLPPTAPPDSTLHPVNDPSFVIDNEQAAAGAKLYHSSCFTCHGARLESTGSIAPDLRESGLASVWEAFRSLLHSGALASAGMPKYDELSDKDLKAIFMYIRHGARAASNEKGPSAPVPSGTGSGMNMF